MEVKIYSAMKGIERVDIKQHVFVVMDILRASNTIIRLMEKGASEVKVVEEVDEAHKLKQHGYFLIGERLGKTIPGFDFDNSPHKIGQHDWSGRKVVLTTTNGTRALVSVQDGFKVVIGSFRNIDAVCKYVKNFDKPIALMPEILGIYQRCRTVVCQCGCAPEFTRNTLPEILVSRYGVLIGKVRVLGAEFVYQSLRPQRRENGHSAPVYRANLRVLPKNGKQIILVIQ